MSSSHHDDDAHVDDAWADLDRIGDAVRASLLPVAAADSGWSSTDDARKEHLSRLWQLLRGAYSQVNGISKMLGVSPPERRPDVALGKDDSLTVRVDPTMGGVTLSVAELRAVIDMVMDEVNGKVPRSFRRLDGNHWQFKNMHVLLDEHDDDDDDAPMNPRFVFELASNESEASLFRVLVRNIYQQAASSAKAAQKSGQGRGFFNERGRQGAIEELKGLGVHVYTPGGEDKLDWSCLAGYSDAKLELKTSVLFPLLFPDRYEAILQSTQVRPKSSVPKAVVFFGPPGTGKTTAARVLAEQMKRPLLYVPNEALLGHFYGETPKKVAQVFELARKLEPCVVFFDEIDSLIPSRSKHLHEATTRYVSTLLREIDGFSTSNSQVLVIGATNRPEDLDQAFMSRVNTTINFSLPDEAARKGILRLYAKHLSEKELVRLAEKTAGFSGRDIENLCSNTTRMWVGKFINKHADDASLAAGKVQFSESVGVPPVDEYLAAVERFRQPSGSQEKNFEL